MARIRSIKPEFPQSESMGRVSRDARLLFILLWPVCDDHGRTRAASRMLASTLFPYDDDAKDLIGAWLDELEREGCIRRYSVNGSAYLEITNWLMHQKIDKPSKPQFPEPYGTLANPRECSSEEGSGREGKGEDLEEHRSPSGERFARAPEDDPGDADPVTSRQTATPQAPARQLEPTETGGAAKALREAGVPDAAPHRPELRAALADGIPVAEMADTARELAVVKPNPKLAYVLATVRGRRADAVRSPAEKPHASKAHPGRESASDRVARINREAEARERIGSGRIIEGGLGHAA